MRSRASIVAGAAHARSATCRGKSPSSSFTKAPPGSTSSSFWISARSAPAASAACRGSSSSSSAVRAERTDHGGETEGASVFRGGAEAVAPGEPSLRAAGDRGDARNGAAADAADSGGADAFFFGGDIFGDFADETERAAAAAGDVGADSGGVPGASADDAVTATGSAVSLRRARTRSAAS